MAGGLQEAGELLAQYHHLLTQPLDDAATRNYSVCKTALEAVDGWRLQQQVETVLTRLQLSPDVALQSLFGYAASKLL